VHGSGYERIASAGCSDSTIRRRLQDWAAAGVTQQVHAVALVAYGRIVGLRLADNPADGCITKARCGGDNAAPSPVDRRKGGPKPSIATEAPVCLSGSSRPAPTVTTRRCWAPWRPPPPRLDRTGPAEVTIHLDAGYDSGVTRTLLDGLGLHGEIAHSGVPAPIQVGKRWVCERTTPG
jgi:hypothetical protein